MSITFTKEPSGIYPAYNDSFIEFTSSLANNTYCEVTVYPLLTFTKKFIVYADLSGKYLFNLKEAVKVIFNESGFSDSNYFTNAFSKTAEGLYLSQNIDIEVFSDIASESVSKTYEFFKAVKQIGEIINTNTFSLLTYTADGINHNLTYFEGFPFSFDIKRIIFTAGKKVNIKSLNTGVLYSGFAVTETGAFRINIDNGNGDNWTSNNILPLIEGLNRLEIYENAVFKCNLNVTKKKNCNGVYLKWFNSSGGFSSHLFERYYSDTLKGKDSDFILNSDLNNIYDSVGGFKNLGKNSANTLKIKTKFQEEEFENLKDIFKSPLIQIYTSKTEYVEGRFIDVNIEGNIESFNKKQFNELSLTVQLPEVITAKL